MDIATLIGIFSAFALVLISIMIGGSLTLFFNIPSIFIVFGGTIGATMIHSPILDVLSVINVAKNVFFTRVWSTQEVVDRFVEFANKSRREGILALESELANVDDPFMVKGLQLADAEGVAIPANWPNNALFGDEVIIPPARTMQDAMERKGKENCLDWWLCHRKV